MVSIENLEKNQLKWAKGSKLNELATQFQEIKIPFADYKTCNNNNICDPVIKRCHLLFKTG